MPAAAGLSPWWSPLLWTLALCACAERGLATDGERGLESGLTDGSDGESPRLSLTQPLPQTADGQLDDSGGPLRIIEVPAVSPWARIVASPEGWFALSVNFGGKTLEGARTALYRSEDGARWELVHLPASGTLLLSDIAYGAGRFVLVGRHDGTPVVWTSSDGEHFTETLQPFDQAYSYKNVVYLNDRFIAFGFRNLGWSLDGVSWTGSTVGLVQLEGAAFGGGRYLLTGSGPVLVSTDGETFSEHLPGCDLLDACVTDPSGVEHPVLLSPLFYAEGTFFTGRLRSTDGERWSVADRVVADGYVDGQFLSWTGSTLRSWTRAGGEDATVTTDTIRHSPQAVTAAGRAPEAVGRLAAEVPLPERVDASFEDGITCKNASCFVLADRLWLMPPPQTPPLPDREPKTADDEPLLSDACPYPRQIFCADYDTRSGCRCAPDAPSSPSQCEDVSRFTCEGRFSAMEGEWPLGDPAEGGCSCTAVDPNQPPTFGDPCTEGEATCQSPLSCLPVQPPPQPFPSPTPWVCTQACAKDDDCPTWTATGHCAGSVRLQCQSETCQPRTCPVP